MAAAAAAAKKKQQQGRRVTADLLWPGPGKKGAPRQEEEDDFEADFREFERGLSEDDDVDGGDDEVQEVAPPEPARFAFAAAAKAPRPAVGEHRIKVATFFFSLSLSRYTWHAHWLDGRKKDVSFAALFLESPLVVEERTGVPWNCGAAKQCFSYILLVSLEWARLFRLSVGTDGCLGMLYAIC